MPTEVDAVQQGLLGGSDLPMYSSCQEIQQLVEKNRVVVIDAATGSGKSTLVPLCLVQQCHSRNLGCRIVVTQPRKIAAKGLAWRVSQLAGTNIGDLVGYRVGGDKVDRGARVVYVTVGHLLEAVVHNPKYLETFTHIVLDEVHERFVEADFLMAFLRMALSRPETQTQRLVIMSAKFQKNKLASFFKPARLPSPERAESAGILLAGGSPFSVQNFVLDDVYRNYSGVARGCKEPDFGHLMPSKKKDMKERQWSDRLTQTCRNLTKLAARLVCYLYREHCEHAMQRTDQEAQGQFANSCVVLAFLPGLDQMHQLADNLMVAYSELKDFLGLPETPPNIILMHSALDERRYREALENPKENEWKARMSQLHVRLHTCTHVHMIFVCLCVYIYLYLLYIFLIPICFPEHPRSKIPRPKIRGSRPKTYIRHQDPKSQGFVA